MIPAAAAIPFMTLRLSILGKKSPSIRREQTRMSATRASASFVRVPRFEREGEDPLHTLSG